MNIDIMLVLYPLDIVPIGAGGDQMHILRAGEDYEVDRSRLPAGWLELGFMALVMPVWM